MTNPLLNITSQTPPTAWDAIGTFLTFCVVALIIITIVENMR